ncbi:vWA domain-containing protein [Streptacidiphilus fuscans]|uniref:VWA domain-containing protein n=1 Tax=Streptacidiphilus fuscans TaxID=2789292 RepID=A0A931FGA6_9ACTN|nr:VWA domain-containing protein [Streptacidiphilus fuscans]MBF9073712.1 VWA domain-containing protein [Streptacidiphilus fuscans]
MISADEAATVAVGFVRTLRAAGADVTPEQVRGFLGALDVLGPALRRDVYWAGRLMLCGDRDDLDRYDRVFSAYFGVRPRGVDGRRPLPLRPRPRLSVGVEPVGEGEPSPAADRPLAALAGSAEVLRHRDIAAMTAAERAQLRRLLAAFTLGGETRRTARRRPSRHARGEVDVRRTMRDLLRHGGEPVRLLRRNRVRSPRRVVLLVDVSGSMTPYADALLRFAHAASAAPAARAARAARTARVSGGSPARTEVFTLGTRLTRVTSCLTHRQPDLAMASLSHAVPDWSGGTRLGETLQAFLHGWGRRGMARGAVVVLLSDGWERGDPAVLAAQMQRLHRLAHRVVWANPRKAHPGYAPLAAGMAAALPSVDVFVEGHSLAALEHLAAVVRGAADA